MVQGARTAKCCPEEMGLQFLPAFNFSAICNSGRMLPTEIKGNLRNLSKRPTKLLYFLCLMFSSAYSQNNCLAQRFPAFSDFWRLIEKLNILRHPVANLRHFSKGFNDKLKIYFEKHIQNDVHLSIANGTLSGTMRLRMHCPAAFRWLSVTSAVVWLIYPACCSLKKAKGAVAFEVFLTFRMYAEWLRLYPSLRIININFGDLIHVQGMKKRPTWFAKLELRYSLTCAICPINKTWRERRRKLGNSLVTSPSLSTMLVGEWLNIFLNSLVLSISFFFSQRFILHSAIGFSTRKRVLHRAHVTMLSPCYRNDQPRAWPYRNKIACDEQRRQSSLYVRIAKNG